MNVFNDFAVLVNKTFLYCFSIYNVYLHNNKYVNTFLETFFFSVQYFVEYNYSILWLLTISTYIFVLSSDKYYTNVFNNFEKHIIRLNNDKKKITECVVDLSNNIDEFSKILTSTLETINPNNINKKIDTVQKLVIDLKQQQIVEKTRLTKLKNNSEENISSLFIRIKNLEELLDNDQFNDDNELANANE